MRLLSFAGKFQLILAHAQQPIQNLVVFWGFMYPNPDIHQCLDMLWMVSGYMRDSIKDGKEPENLDECVGHIDEKLGYHYHIGKPGDNEIIVCFRGPNGSSEVGK